MGRRGGEAALMDLTQSDGEQEQQKKRARRGPTRGAGAHHGSAGGAAAAAAAAAEHAAAATAAATEPAAAATAPGARPGRPPVQAAAAAAAAARAGQPLDDLAAPAAAAATAMAAGVGVPKRRRSGGGGSGGRGRSGGRGGGSAGSPAPKKSGKERREDEYGNTVSWRPKAAQGVLTRIARAQGGHRLMLLARKPVRPLGAEGGAAEEFAVYGATGNAYTVTICRQPRCTCPDSAKANVCKHTLFVLLRVLNMSPEDPLVWQKALLGSEVDEILGGQKSLPRTLGGGEVLAPAAVREQYRRRTSIGGQGEGEGEEGGPLRRSAEGADCPICYERLDVASEKVSFCAACGNNCHASCIGEWVKNCRRQGAQPTCPLCRAAWVDGAAPAGAAGAGEYLNLADAAGAPVPTLEELYGDSALWIHAHQGDIPRGVAANIWRSMGH